MLKNNSGATRAASIVCTSAVDPQSPEHRILLLYMLLKDSAEIGIKYCTQVDLMRARQRNRTHTAPRSELVQFRMHRLERVLADDYTARRRINTLRLPTAPVRQRPPCVVGAVRQQWQLVPLDYCTLRARHMHCR